MPNKSIYWTYLSKTNGLFISLQPSSTIEVLAKVVYLDNPEHMHPVQKEKERQIGSKRFDLNSHSGRYAPIFREKSGIQFIFIESLEKAAVR